MLKTCYWRRGLIENGEYAVPRFSVLIKTKDSRLSLPMLKCLLTHYSTYAYSSSARSVQSEH